LSARRRSRRSCAKGCGSTAGGRLRRANRPTHIRPYGAPSPNGRRNLSAHHPPIVSISRAANPLLSLAFKKMQRHEPSALSPVPDSSHPVGGEGVGSSAPMSAGCGRAMKPGGWILRGSSQGSMDGSCLLAARFPRGPLAHVATSAARRRPQGRRRDPVRSELRATTRRARGKRLRGAVPSLPDRDFTGGSEGRPRSGFVETVKQSKLRARPGRPAPSPTFPAAMPAGEDAWMEGG
jgi:hypothetical protein